VSPNPKQVKEKLEQKKNIATETPKPEQKPKREKKKAPAKENAGEIFPVESRINGYGFIFIKNHWLEALGWTKGMALKIERICEKDFFSLFHHEA